MTVKLFENFNTVKPLNISSSNYNNDSEMVLQEMAEVPFSIDHQGVRQQLATKQQEEDIDDLYRASEMALASGADSKNVADMVKAYIPQDTTNISLEYEAASKATDKALVDDEVTYNNSLDDEEDILQNVEDFAINLKFSEMIDGINSEASEHPWKLLGSYVLHGMSSDLLLFDEIKKTVTSVNWGDSRTYDDMNKAFINTYNAVKENTGLEGVAMFLDEIKSQISSLPSTAAKYQMKMIMTEGDTFGDFGNGLPLLFSPKPAATSAKLAGNKKLAAKLIKNSDNIVEKIPSAVKKTVSKDPTVNISNMPEIHDSLKATAKDSKVVEIVNKYKGEYGQVLTDLDKEIVRKSLDLKEDSKRLDIVDLTDVMQDDLGDTHYTVLLGDGLEGQSSMTKRGVDNLAKKLGIEDYSAVKRDGSGYYLKTTIKGSSTDLDTSDFGVMGVGRVFFGSTNMPAWFHEELIANYRKATKMEQVLFEEYGSALRKLNKSQKEDFTALYLEGQKANNNSGTWWNVDKLVKDGDIDKATADAYTAFRKVSDIDYIVANEKVRNKLVRFGYVSDADGDIVKTIKKGISKTPNYSQMRIKYGDDIITSSTHSAEQIDQILKNGDVLVEVAPISVKSKNLDYTHKIINPSKLLNKLASNILPYRAGGRRRYAYGTNFIKIGVTKNYGGELVNAYSKVLGATQNVKEALAIRDELNKALQLMKKLEEGIDSATVNKQIVRDPFKYLKISNTEDLRAATEGLDLDQVVQVVKEGESMVYNNGRRTLHEDPLDYDISFAELAKTRGTFDQKRGHILDNLIGDDARLVSPFDIFEQTVKRASYDNSLGELYDQMGQIFKIKYMDFIDTRAIPNPRTLSGEELLRHGTLKNLKEVPDIQKQALREAINMQNIYRRLSNTPTEIDKYVRRMMNNLASAISKLGVSNPKALENIAKSDPFAYGRAILFQTTLGMFNLKQLWAQSLGAITMSLSHPLVYTRAILTAPFVMTGYALRNSPAFKNIVKGVTTLTGLSPKDFDNLLRYFDEMGTTMGTYRMPMSERIRTWNGIEKVGAVLRSPVELGTNISNVVNDVAAYLATPSRNFKKIAARADDWSMNQTRATQSVFQAGQYLPTKTIAQFTSWPYRIMESMAFNKRLTRLERASILLGQVAMWGAAGTLLSNEDASTVNRKLYPYMKDMPEWLKDAFIDGAITSYFKEEFGINVDEGIEGGNIISGFYNIVESVLDGDLSSIEFELPGSFKAVSRLSSTLKATLELAWGLSMDDDFEALKYAHTVVSDKNVASSFRNTARAFIGWYYNKAFNTAGNLVSDKVTKEQSVGMLFGANITEATTSAELYNIYSDHRKVITELYEDGLEPLIKDMSAELNMSATQRLNAASKFRSTLKSLRAMIYSEYGRSGLREFNKLVKKGLSQRSVQGNNKRYGRQHGEIVLQYLSDLNYNRSEK